MLEVSDEKVSVVGKVLCERAYRKIKKTKEGGFDANQQVLCERAYRKIGYASPRRIHLMKQLGGVS
jgi:hypothetical protein